ncbi:MAG: hypothetical protein ABIE84_02715 [bacterium]
MKRKIVLGLVVTVIGLSQMALASVGMNVTYVSNYIWRGFDNLGSGSYNGSAAIQPGISVPVGETGVSVSLWGNYALNSPAGFYELDAIVDYSSTLQTGLDYSLGYTYYTFPTPGGVAYATSGELYAGLTWADFLYSPKLTVYYDHVTTGGNGLYANLSGGTEIIGIATSLGVGYNAGQWGATPGVSDISVGLTKTYGFVTSSINYVYVPSSAGINAETSEIWFGLNIEGEVL